MSLSKRSWTKGAESTSPLVSCQLEASVACAAAVDEVTTESDHGAVAEGFGPAVAKGAPSEDPLSFVSNG